MNERCDCLNVCGDDPRCGKRQIVCCNRTYRASQPHSIYLCGPIEGRTDDECRTWRQLAAALWPTISPSGTALDPMRRDYRGKELSDPKALVEADLVDIDASDGLLVYYDKPSVGTSMEIFYAKTVQRLPIVLVTAPGAIVRSPWLVHHVDAIAEDVPAGLTLLHTLIIDVLV